MKKNLITFILFFLLTMHSIGQNNTFLNGYKYAQVGVLKYPEGRTDNYGITSKLMSNLNKKGFFVLPDDNNSWPTEAKVNTCLILFCYPHTSGSSTVGLTIKNCKNETIFEEESTSINWIDDYQDNYNRAFSKCWKIFDNYLYHFDASKTPEEEFPTVEKTNETEESIRTYLTSNKLDPIEGIYNSYQSAISLHYKIGIIKKDNAFKAIIIESELKAWKPSEVKGIFERSTMNGFYSAKWFMGDKSTNETFATLENNVLLSIELKDKKGEKIQGKFIKMFPTKSENTSPKKDQSKASGSGFFLSSNGIIATNAHVIEDASNIEITFTNEIGSFTYKAKVLLTDAKNDVALLKIDDEKFKGFNSIPYGISEKAETGEKVFTIGYPLNDVMGTNYKVNDGIISSKSGIADDIRYYQISVPLQPGNSGGPLFNKEGNVIGISSARLNGEAVGTKVENVNYAIKASYLLNLYNMLPSSSRLNSTSQVANKELQEQVKVLKNYVCLIRIF